MKHDETCNHVAETNIHRRREVVKHILNTTSIQHRHSETIDYDLANSWLDAMRVYYIGRQVMMYYITVIYRPIYLSTYLTIHLTISIHLSINLTIDAHTHT